MTASRHATRGTWIVGAVKPTAHRLVFPSGLRAGQFMIVNGRIRPLVAGGSDDGAGGGGDSGTSAVEMVGGGGAGQMSRPAPDLDKLQTALDQASKNAGSKATNDLLAALGFQDLDTAKTFIKTARAREDAEKTELQKAQEAAARAELTASQARAEAAAATRARLIERALTAKGADPAHVERLTRLVDVPADADETTVTAEIDKIADEFPGVFTRPAGDTAPPAGNTGAKAPAKQIGGKTAYERGQERWRAAHPTEKAS